ncbi:MAG TPA: hypothetical protein VGQ37_14615 [Vicinamibacterales bacterium]|jgi:hypothetical protein|nr:hypothetical protein [Vicinamibacterales bacterium]
MPKKTLVVSCALAVLSLAAPALAGPPFLCHVFDIGSTASLSWVDGDWLGTRSDYDITRVVADTQALLKTDMPTLARMETLRRAVLYASRDRALAERLVAALAARVDAADKGGRTDARALFDLGYALEAINEVEELAHYASDLADRGRALAGMTRPHEGQALILKSASLRTDDAGIAFALALISKTEDRQPHLLKARAGAKQDRLLASNMARLQMQ